MHRLTRTIGIAARRDETLTALCGAHTIATHDRTGSDRFGKAVLARGRPGEVVTHYDEGVSIIIADDKAKNVSHAVKMARGSIVIVVTESEPDEATLKVVKSINESARRCAGTVSTGGGAATLCRCVWGHGIKATVEGEVVRAPSKAKRGRRVRSAATVAVLPVEPVQPIAEPTPTPDPDPTATDE